MRAHTRSVTLVAALIAASACGNVTAKRLYRCDSGNSASYQDSPCAKPESQKVVGHIVVEEVPAEHASSWVSQAPAAPAASPPGSRQMPHQSSNPAALVREEPQSFRCVASNGAVFYRHDRCPSTVDHKTFHSAHYDRSTGNQVVTSTPTYSTVTTEKVSRKEACREMGTIANRSRRDRNRDGAASTYERNLGRDPCR